MGIKALKGQKYQVKTMRPKGCNSVFKYDDGFISYTIFPLHTKPGKAARNGLLLEPEKRIFVPL